MNFEALFKRISPRLRKIARNHNRHGFFIDEGDLYQEMCIHLWNNFKDGVPFGINCAYIVRGCEFHILNYLRKEREKARIVSLEAPLDENGNTLRDILPDTRESLDKCIDRKLIIEDIRNDGLTKREKEIFSLCLEGLTTREIGKKFGISHVMVVKLRKRIKAKCKNLLDTFGDP